MSKEKRNSKTKKGAYAFLNFGFCISSDIRILTFDFSPPELPIRVQQWKPHSSF
jgi:hypothetical protein